MSDPQHPPPGPGNETTQKPRPQAIVQIGPLKLVGPAATAFVFTMAAGFVALIGYTRPAPRPIWISAVLWIAFVMYWNAAARGAAAAKSAESVQSRRVHEWLMNGALLLLFLPIPGLTSRFVPDTRMIVVVGLAVHVASFLLAVRARRHLGKNWSGAIQAKVGHELIRTGPYALVRHPIYTAMLGMFAGTALVSGQLHALIGFVMICVAYGRKIPLEEATLRATFGDSYAEYQRETKAVIPWVV